MQLISKQEVEFGIISQINIFYGCMGNCNYNEQEKYVKEGFKIISII